LRGEKTRRIWTKTIKAEIKNLKSKIEELDGKLDSESVDDEEVDEIQDEIRNLYVLLAQAEVIQRFLLFK